MAEKELGRIMKIVIYGIRGIPANYGGFETCVEETAQRFVKAGHSVTVYCRYSQYKEHRPTYKGVRLIYLRSIPTKSLETLTHTLFSTLHLLLFHRQVDCVHLYNPGSSIFIPLIKLFKRKVNVTVTVDGIEWNRDKWGRFAKIFLEFVMWFTTKASDNVVCDSKVVRDYFARKFDYNMAYIPYGAKLLEEADDSYLRFDLRRKMYLLYVGRLVPEKGVHNLIEVYKKLNTDYPLVIVGDAPYNKEYVHSLKRAATANIMFLGYQYGQTYDSLLKNSLIYVSASMVEGTSPSLLAAMGAKVCCLVNGIPENLVTIGDSALAYRRNDLDDLEEKLRWLLANGNIIARYSKKGYQRAKERYSWDDVARRYAEIYKNHKSQNITGLKP